MEYSKYSEWNQTEKDALYELLQSLLRSGEVNLTFEKKDGTIRDMVCTLKEDEVKPYEKKTDKEKKVNKEVMSVFDVEKQEWRSFRLESLKNFRGTLK